MSHTYDTVHALLKTGDSESIRQGLFWYQQNVTTTLSDTKALFEYAGAFDFLGREAEALPLYEQVLQAGYQNLPDEDQSRLFVQLGSTLRNLGQIEKSRDIFYQGIKAFPDNSALKAFLALTEFSANNPDKSLQLLFEIFFEQASDPSLHYYSRALRWYSEHLSAFSET